MEETTLRVLIVFGLSLVIIFLTAKIIGEENKRKWFKKRTKQSIFTRRGLLGEGCHFGRPCTWQGFVVAFIMIGAIAVLGYIFIFTDFLIKR